MKVKGHVVNDAKVFSGRLMSPAEVAEALAGKAGVLSAIHGWYLCGDMTERGYDSLVRNPDRGGVRLSSFIGPLGGTYLVVTHQSMACQHRFLLSLGEETVQAFLTSLAEYPLQATLGCDGGSAAVVVNDQLDPVALKPLLKPYAKPVDNVGLYLSEYRLAVDRASKRGGIPSVLADVPVKDVSLSIVPPESVVQRMRIDLMPEPSGAMQ